MYDTDCKMYLIARYERFAAYARCERKIFIENSRTRSKEKAPKNKTLGQLKQ